MSTYVMSDLHGNYKSYKTMFEKINFQDQDMMYILGDVLDRGPNPIQIILDLMQTPCISMPMDFGSGYASTYVIFRVDESRAAGRINRCSEPIARIKDELTRGEVDSKDSGNK